MTGVNLAIDTISAGATAGIFPVRVKCYFEYEASFVVIQEFSVEIIDNDC